MHKHYINTVILNLSSNRIGNEGGIALAKALCKNISISFLSIRINNIGVEGGKALAKTLYINATLN